MSRCVDGGSTHFACPCNQERMKLLEAVALEAKATMFYLTGKDSPSWGDSDCVRLLEEKLAALEKGEATRERGGV